LCETALMFYQQFRGSPDSSRVSSARRETVGLVQFHKYTL
jgi:hypothetical protein